MKILIECNLDNAAFPDAIMAVGRFYTSQVSR